MASVIYDSFWPALYGASLNGATVKCMLINNSYALNRATHTSRADLTAYEVTGTGYTAGGVTVTQSWANDTVNHAATLTLGAASWASSTITAYRAVYYISTGVAANDKLLAYNDFGSAQSSSSGTFGVAASTIKIQA